MRSFAEADEADLAEWLALEPAERVRIGEEMRREVLGASTDRVERTLRIRPMRD